jgi:hypothetical protein
MALGAVTITRSGDVLGNQRVVDCTIVGPASYTTGGDTLSPSALGLTAIQRGIAVAESQAATVGPGEIDVIPQADGTAKLKTFVAAGTGENAGAANLSATTWRVVVWGY